jgi:ATP-dependent exoDNAse (exonuclease V) alpha subunit
VISRSAGRRATAAAAYRAGTLIEDRRTGQVHDYDRRSGVVHAEILTPENTPAWMADRNALWNAVEIAVKRRDAQLSREVQLALPHELDASQRLSLVREYVRQAFVARHGRGHRYPCAASSG